MECLEKFLEHKENSALKHFIATEIRRLFRDILSNEDAPSAFMSILSKRVPGFQNKMNKEKQEKFISHFINLKHHHSEWFSTTEKYLICQHPTLFSDTNSPSRSMPTFESSNEETTVKSPFKSPPIPSTTRNSLQQKKTQSPSKNYEQGRCQGM